MKCLQFRNSGSCFHFFVISFIEIASVRGSGVSPRGELTVVLKCFYSCEP